MSRHQTNETSTWGRKCSLFPKYMNSLPFRELMISPINYEYMTEFVSLQTVSGLMTGLFACISLTTCIGIILLSKALWYAKLYMVTCT